MLGTLIPHNPSDGEAFSHHFNLEYLEDSFVFNLIENAETDSADKADHMQSKNANKTDILSDALGDIVNGIADENILSEQVNERVNTFRKGRKRGQKLGYRSKNTNDDNALCGVCGAKVSFRTLKVSKLFFPDSEWLALHLSDSASGEVERTQEQWARHAHGYCKQGDRVTGYRTRLGEIIMTIARVREMVEIEELRIDI